MFFVFRGTGLNRHRAITHRVITPIMTHCVMNVKPFCVRVALENGRPRRTRELGEVEELSPAHAQGMGGGGVKVEATAIGAAVVRER